MPAIMRPRVDFPQPDSPTRPTTSPFATLRLTSVTARTISVFGACAEKPGDALAEIGVLYEALRYVVDVKESGWHETGSIG